MGGNIGDVVDATHHFPWVDEEGDATRHSGPLVVGGTHNPVGGADHMVDVGAERKRELVLLPRFGRRGKIRNDPGQQRATGQKC